MLVQASEFVPTAGALALALALVKALELAIGGLTRAIKSPAQVTPAPAPPSSRCPGLPELDRSRLQELCETAREQLRLSDRIGLQLERLAVAQEEIAKALREKPK